MALELLRTMDVQEGLRELVDSAYSMRQNLEARVETPVLDDKTDLWRTWLDSKTMSLHSGINQDNRHRFKIEHDFDLAKIVNVPINPGGSISIYEATYMQSEGAEFIIISKSDLKGATADYAIRTNRYELIRHHLKKGKYTAEQLEQTGLFKINAWLKPEEIKGHNGWLELVVGKNNAPKNDYREAYQFLKDKYVPKAKENRCFQNKQHETTPIISMCLGMDFSVRINESGCKVLPWSVNSSDGRSDAFVGAYSRGYGRFLRVGRRRTKFDT